MLRLRENGSLLRIALAFSWCMLSVCQVVWHCSRCFTCISPQLAEAGFFFFFKPPFRDEEIEAQRFKTLRVLRKKCQDHNLNPYCLAPVSDSSVLSYCIFWCFWDCSAFNLMILNLSLHPSSPLTSVISIPAASWVALPESLAGTCNST